MNISLWSFAIHLFDKVLNSEICRKHSNLLTISEHNSPRLLQVFLSLSHKHTQAHKWSIFYFKFPHLNAIFISCPSESYFIRCCDFMPLNFLSIKLEWFFKDQTNSSSNSSSSSNSRSNSNSNTSAAADLNSAKRVLLAATSNVFNWFCVRTRSQPDKNDSFVQSAFSLSLFLRCPSLSFPNYLLIFVGFWILSLVSQSGNGSSLHLLSLQKMELFVDRAADFFYFAW